MKNSDILTNIKYNLSRFPTVRGLTDTSFEICRSSVKILHGLIDMMLADITDNDGESLMDELCRTIILCHALDGNQDVDGEAKMGEVFRGLPSIQETLLEDAEAIYRADPSARSVTEIMLCYPGFFAIAVYRIAHLLYTADIPYMPRIMSEYAHSKTGIDIHPGATIGVGLCIDHGTGVVIGETAVVGDRVRIYQGVTLGAKSLHTESTDLRGIKRHPTVGNDCVIYANATILGGDTVIGDSCTVGGNVWLTHSLPLGHTVFYEKK